MPGADLTTTPAPIEVIPSGAPDADFDTAGIMQVATLAETNAGVLQNVAITPWSLASWFAGVLVGGGYNDGPITARVVVLEAITARHVHVQAIPAPVWVINHTLNRRPDVVTVDSAGSEVTGDVTYPTLAQVVITFGAAFSGEAEYR